MHRNQLQRQIYALLAESKKKLADLQLELIQKEIKMKEEIFNKEMQLLDVKIKGQQLTNKQLELAEKDNDLKVKVRERKILLLDLNIESQTLQNKILAKNGKNTAP
jgi:hypothetical protein